MAGRWCGEVGKGMEVEMTEVVASLIVSFIGVVRSAVPSERRLTPSLFKVWVVDKISESCE